jgi:hypothetical protein
MLLLPPVFLAPDQQSDLIVGVANTMVLRVVHLPRAPGDVPALDEAMKLVRRLLDVEPSEGPPGWPGVEATAIGSAQYDDQVRNVAAIVGGDGASRATVVLTLDYKDSEVDVATALTVWSAHVGSVWFSGEPREIPELVPASVWWSPGFPLRLAASRPALPAIDGVEIYAGGLLDVSDMLPPSLAIGETQRADIAAELAKLEVGNALQIAGTLATIHDYRGLAFALLAADLARTSAPSAAMPPPPSMAMPPAPSMAMPPLPSMAMPPAPSMAMPPAPSMAMPPPPSMAMPPAPSGAVPGPAMQSRVISISAAEAAAHGLPAVGVRLDLGDTALYEMRRTVDRVYVMASGLPGATLVFEVTASAEAASNHDAVRRAVVASGVADVEWGPVGTVTLAGRSCPAVTFQMGAGMYRSHWCAALVPHARGAVLVSFGHSHVGSAVLSCDQVASSRQLAPLVASFALVDG